MLIRFVLTDYINMYVPECWGQGAVFRSSEA